MQRKSNLSQYADPNDVVERASNLLASLYMAATELRPSARRTALLEQLDPVQRMIETAALPEG